MASNVEQQNNWNKSFKSKANIIGHTHKPSQILVSRYDYNGNFVNKRFINKYTCMDMGLNYQAVMNASKANSKMISYLGHIWVREGVLLKDELQRKLKLRKQMITKEDYIDSIKKEIVQIDIETKTIVDIYPSIVSTEESGDYDSVSISNVINNRQKTHKNCIWAIYEDDIDYNATYIESLINDKLNSIKNRPKKIIKYNLSKNKVIGEYNSIAHASKETGISRTTITKMIKGEKTGFKDFIFKMKEDKIFNINPSDYLLTDLNNIKKPIIQIDINTKKIINTYASITAAEKKGYNRVNISKVINGKDKKYRNCIWVKREIGIKYTQKYINNLINTKLNIIKEYEAC